MSPTAVPRNQSQPTTTVPRKNAGVDNPALYITRKQAAELISTTPQFVDKLLRLGIITAYRFGFPKKTNKRRKLELRIRRDELLAYIERGAER